LFQFSVSVVVACTLSNSHPLWFCFHSLLVLYFRFSDGILLQFSVGILFGLFCWHLFFSFFLLVFCLFQFLVVLFSSFGILFSVFSSAGAFIQFSAGVLFVSVVLFQFSLLVLFRTHVLCAFGFYVSSSRHSIEGRLPPSKPLSDVVPDVDKIVVKKKKSKRRGRTRSPSPSASSSSGSRSPSRSSSVSSNGSASSRSRSSSPSSLPSSPRAASPQRRRR